MEHVLLGALLAGCLAGMSESCPFHCVCQNLSESLSTLCANKGLLFVPPNIDRRTVELRLADNFLLVTGMISPTPYNSVVSLSFGGNPLHCNCELLWLRRLVREDDMETCASPPQLVSRYFWSIPEEEFTCEPPLITRHTHTLWILEGQRATLRCRAIGDPEPLIHWVSPKDRIMSNSSRTASYRNGTLDILVTSVRDDGPYTCIAINAAGESTAVVDLKIIPLPHRSNGTAHVEQRDPGSSDITTSAKTGANGSGETGSRAPEKPVRVTDVTSTSALVRWFVGKSSYYVWMYQIQYNCTADETLVYR
ncbi:UNVERIFIED_CONTAM: hypothetical protein FKN15_004490 [Acipenser sinensis]